MRGFRIREVREFKEINETKNARERKETKAIQGPDMDFIMNTTREHLNALMFTDDDLFK